MHELEKHISKDDCSFNKQGLNNASLVVDFMPNLKKVNVLGYRSCPCKYGICYLTHATFNVWMLFMIVTSVKIQLSILKEKAENLQTTYIIFNQMDKV